jgi:hypothetical protein
VYAKETSSYPLRAHPEEFDRIVRADIETFKKVGKLAGLIAP